jgi:signal transduction histidine kinase
VIELATAVSQEGLVTLTVRDGGPGIAPADLDRVFDSFFTTKHDGMGIGLAICQSIIAAHGGSITASNHPDGGAIFAISLPTAARV